MWECLDYFLFGFGRQFILVYVLSLRVRFQVIKEMTDGGADYCFECTGLTSLMQEAFSSSRGVKFHSLINFLFESNRHDSSLIELR